MTLLLRHKVTVLYTAVILFIAVGLLSVKFGFMPLLGLPLVLFVGFLAAFYTETFFKFLFFITPLSIPVNDIGGGFGISLPAEPMIMLMSLGIVISWFMGKKPDTHFWKHPITWLVVINFIWLIVSTIYSSMPFISVKYTIARFWMLSVFFFGCFHFFKTGEGNLKTFIWLLMIGVSGMVLYTLYVQSIHGFGRGVAHTAMRPLLPDHGVYAACIAFFIPIGAMFAIYGHHMRFTLLQRSIALGIVVLFLVGIVFSFTRASWLSLAFAGGIWVMLTLKVRYWMLLLAFFIVLGTVITFWEPISIEMSRNKQGSAETLENHLASVYNVTTDPSNLERLNRWNAAMNIHDDYPITGIGPGTYTFQYAAYQKSYDLTVISTRIGDVGNVHSEYLRPLAESGWVSFITIVLLAFVSMGMGFQVYYNAATPEIKYIAMGLVVGLATYYFHGLVNNYSEFDKIAAPLWGFIAGLIFLQKRNKELNEKVPT